MYLHPISLLPTSSWRTLTMGLLCTGWIALLPGTTHAQGSYARVLDATPVYRSVAVPQQSCTELQQHTRCTNTTVYEEQLIGYDVLYEYAGQQHVQRMAHDPGVQVPVDHSGAPTSYGSQPAAAATAVTPGRKSYGSIPAGAPVVDSIELRGNEHIPVYVEAQPPQRPHPPQRPRPAYPPPR